LIPKSVTLHVNDLERRNGPILRYFTKFGSFRAHLMKMVEDTPILYATEM